MNDDRAPSLWWGMWKRFLIAGVVIIALSGAATATVALDRLNTISSEVFIKANHISAPKGLVTAEYSGGPQTFLILGSDRREKSKDTLDREDPPHSDTILLVRFDPSQGQTSVMSIPRDLMVNIVTRSGQIYANEKINAAYTIGSKLGGATGASLLAAETIKREVFPELKLNGIVDVNFAGFIRVVDTLGCAYVNVDHRYYNENVGSTETDYTSINLQPGYQKLCYENALDYVRYRHTDSDFVRVARQQDFLRDLRQQINPANELGQIDNVAKAVGHAITSTFPASTSELIRLTKLIAFSQTKPLRQVKFLTANVNYQLKGGDYVTSTPQLEKEALDRFLLGHEQLQLPAAAGEQLPPSLRPWLPRLQLGVLCPRPRPRPDLLGRRERSRQGRPRGPLPRAVSLAADRPGRTAGGAPVLAEEPAEHPPSRLCGRVAAEQQRRLLRLRGHRLAQPAAVRPCPRAGDRRAGLPLRRRRRPHPRARLALRERPLLGHQHAAGGTLELADARPRQIGAAAALTGAFSGRRRRPGRGRR